ncbi:hypothetical protein AHAS_Ahas17G0162900 [Arachis hypogaea]
MEKSYELIIYYVDEQHSYKQALQYNKMVPKQNVQLSCSSIPSNRSPSPNSCNASGINENEVRQSAMHHI